MPIGASLCRFFSTPRAAVATFVILAAGNAAACDTALLLAIDVSNSVDEAEYRMQIDGLADALEDPDIVEILVDGNVALAVMQWSGETDQSMTQPWARMSLPSDAAALSAAVRTTPRAFALSDTAPAEAIDAALSQFADVADCTRRVIDVSGDGTANAGGDVARVRLAAERAGVTINGLAIESMGLAISGYYRRSLVTRDGFVITARTHRDYPRAIREKLIRELSRPIG